jgi:hypothetical protein
LCFSVWHFRSLQAQERRDLLSVLVYSNPLLIAWNILFSCSRTIILNLRFIGSAHFI